MTRRAEACRLPHQSFRNADFNFWGVTFAASDSNMFYATDRRRSALEPSSPIPIQQPLMTGDKDSFRRQTAQRVTPARVAVSDSASPITSGPVMSGRCRSHQLRAMLWFQPSHA
jgi:hypothetical protein